MREAKRYLWYCLGQIYSRRTEGRAIFKLFFFCCCYCYLFFRRSKQKAVYYFIIELVISQEAIWIIQEKNFVFSLNLNSQLQCPFFARLPPSVWFNIELGGMFLTAVSQDPITWLNRRFLCLENNTKV